MLRAFHTLSRICRSPFVFYENNLFAHIYLTANPAVFYSDINIDVRVKYLIPTTRERKRKREREKERERKRQREKRHKDRKKREKRERADKVS